MVAPVLFRARDNLSARFGDNLGGEGKGDLTYIYI